MVQQPMKKNETCWRYILLPSLLIQDTSESFPNNSLPIPANSIDAFKVFVVIKTTFTTWSDWNARQERRCFASVGGWIIVERHWLGKLNQVNKRNKVSEQCAGENQSPDDKAWIAPVLNVDDLLYPGGVVEKMLRFFWWSHGGWSGLDWSRLRECEATQDQKTWHASQEDEASKNLQINQYLKIKISNHYSMSVEDDWTDEAQDECEDRAASSNNTIHSSKMFLEVETCEEKLQKLIWFYCSPRTVSEGLYIREAPDPNMTP